MMIRRFAVLAAAVLAASPALAADSYSFDKAHTTVLFQVRHIVTNVTGKFKDFEGQIQVDKANPAASTVDFTIQAASIDTNEPKRDEHLRSADFFNVAEFPTMTYKSTNVVFAGDTPTVVQGELTLLGVTKPVAITVERFRCNPATATAKERCGGSATAKIKRSDFGMKRGIPSIGDDVALSFGFEGDKD